MKKYRNIYCDIFKLKKKKVFIKLVEFYFFIKILKWIFKVILYGL